MHYAGVACDMKALDAIAARHQLLVIEDAAHGMNAAYHGRPDDRPWSERHRSLLWTAMLLAVAVLGGLAIRSLKAASA